MLFHLPEGTLQQMELKKKKKKDCTPFGCRELSITGYIKVKAWPVTGGVAFAGKLHFVALNILPALRIFWFCEDGKLTNTCLSPPLGPQILCNLPSMYGIAAVRHGLSLRNSSYPDSSFRPRNRHWIHSCKKLELSSFNTIWSQTFAAFFPPCVSPFLYRKECVRSSLPLKLPPITAAQDGLTNSQANLPEQMGDGQF